MPGLLSQPRGGLLGYMDAMAEYRDMLSQIRAAQVPGPSATHGAFGSPNPSLQTKLDAVALGTSLIPGIGDIAGVGADAYRYATDPESRTWKNAALTGIGMLPFIPGATVFHGSPHRFDKFDISKIGTGEGAQAFGHGLYFAENPAVAKTYAAVGEPAYKNAGVRAIVSDAMSEAQAAGLSGEEARKWAMNRINELAMERPPYSRGQWFDAHNNLDSILDDPVGTVYKAEIPDDQIEKMLDWDAPLRKQPENVRKAFLLPGDKATQSGFSPDMKASDAYALLSHRLGGMDKASAMLNSLGIPGVKYLDAGSRAGGEGTRNYVAFDDALVKILERE